MAVAKRKVFDLDKFEKVSIELEYTEPADLTDVSQVSNIPAETLLALVNAGLKRQAWKDARASIVGASPKVVNQMVNAFRMVPPYSTLLKKDSSGEITADSRKAQTQAIYAFIRSTPAILDSLKAAMTIAEDSDEDETDE